jgi:transmembrane sensor
MSETERREKAVEWLLRLQSPQVNAAEVQEWIAWCDASPQNKQEFARMQAIWQQTGALPVEPLEILAPSRRPWPWAIAAGVAALAVLGALTWTQLVSQRVRTEVSFATSTGVNRDIRLPDGTNVTLAAGSRLVTQYSARMRQVSLESGEAFFKVKKDKNRPFAVHALDTTVTAVGTAFNVRAEQGVVKVAVTEGLVDVKKAGTVDSREENIRVAAGRQVTFVSINPKPVLSSIDVERTTAWREGTLEFMREPLPSVVAAVNRYAETPIALGSHLAHYNYTGTVAVDRVQEWLRGLPDIYPVEIRERDGGGVSIEVVSP